MTVAEVNAVAQAFHDGVANRDTAALVGLYHKDARFLPPNMPACQGHAQIQAGMDQLLAAGIRSLDIEPLETREAGELTIEYGRFTIGIQPPGGQSMTDEGKYVVVHETRDGDTKIVLDIFNSNTAPPA